MISKTLITWICMLLYVSSIEITLQGSETCYRYEVQVPSTKLFSFHYNHNLVNVNMILYQKGTRQILQQTGFGINYKHSLQVTYNQIGEYLMCFLKKDNSSVTEVQFEIINQMDTSLFAGKEELSKLSKRISDFLVEIKKVGWTFKGVLEQHNSRKEKIMDQENYFGFLMFLKVIAMVVILGLQIFAVKKIYS